MLKNHPLPDKNGGEKIIRHREIYEQGRYVRSSVTKRSLLGSPNAPIVICRGHSDFVDLKKLFAGNGQVYNIGTEVTVLDLMVGVERVKIGGFRGVPYYRGVWSDEIKAGECFRLVKNLPRDLDILVTHAPAYGMMDTGPDKHGYHQSWGIPTLSGRFYGSQSLKLHCFGYVRKTAGVRVQNPDGTGVFSCNAATGHAAIELKDGRVQLKALKTRGKKAHGR